MGQRVRMAPSSGCSMPRPTARSTEQMELETETIANLARSEDSREGIAAFLAKRAPVFKGR